LPFRFTWRFLHLIALGAACFGDVGVAFGSGAELPSPENVALAGAASGEGTLGGP
jgi:hypothetical protein